MILGAGLLASIAVAVTIGPAELSLAEVAAAVGAQLTGGDSGLSVTRDAIVWELRFPRVLTAAAVGAGLALCGAVMQALTRNQLADPYLLGLSSGASLGAVSVLLLGAAIDAQEELWPLYRFLAVAASGEREGASGDPAFGSGM